MVTVFFFFFFSSKTNVAIKANNKKNALSMLKFKSTNFSPLVRELLCLSSLESFCFLFFFFYAMDLDAQLNELRLQGDEEEGMELESAGENDVGGRLDLCLVGRFISQKAINESAMEVRMSEIWRPMKGVHITEIPGNRFLFQFFHRVDLQRVIEGGPWTFDNSPLLVTWLDNKTIPRQVPLVGMDIWIQIYDIPVGYFFENTGKLLGNFIGQFLEYDPKNSQAIWRDYMRVRVCIDVRLPLKRYKKINLAGGNSVKVIFKYERLPIFCFNCGIIGHMDRFCPKILELKDDEEELPKEWSADLRAPARKPGNGGDKRWLRDAMGGKVTAGSLSGGDMDSSSGMGNEGSDGHDVGCYMGAVNKSGNFGNKSGELNNGIVGSGSQIVNSQSNVLGQENMGLELVKAKKRRRGPTLPQEENMEVDKQNAGLLTDGDERKTDETIPDDLPESPRGCSVSVGLPESQTHRQP